MKFILLFLVTTFSFSVNAQTKNEKYLHTLPIGYKLTDSNNEEGKRCEKDIDGDSKKDLIVQLFNEYGDGIIVIYLSSTFEKSKTYQWFDWIFSSNYLDINCGEKIEILGSMESMGIFQKLTLAYSTTQKKMIVKSYKDSLGEVSFKIYSGTIK